MSYHPACSRCLATGITLVEKTLKVSFGKNKPERLIGDRAYDSGPLDTRLELEGIKMTTPYRREYKELKTWDRRWKVERLFARLGNFQRLMVRYERRPENYLSFVQLGWALILLRSIGGARSWRG